MGDFNPDLFVPVTSVTQMWGGAIIKSILTTFRLTWSYQVNHSSVEKELLFTWTWVNLQRVNSIHWNRAYLWRSWKRRRWWNGGLVFFWCILPEESMLAKCILKWIRWIWIFVESGVCLPGLTPGLVGVPVVSRCWRSYSAPCEWLERRWRWGAKGRHISIAWLHDHSQLKM